MRAPFVAGDAERVREPVLHDVGREVAEHVEVFLRVVNLGAERAEERRAEIPRPKPQSEIQSAGEIGVRAADDGAIRGGDAAVAVHVHELDAANLGAILTRRRGAGPADTRAVRGGIGRGQEVAVRDQSVEGAHRLADLLDDRVPDARDLRAARADERIDLAVDPQDLVPAATAVEAYAPHLPARDGTAVRGREVKPLVAHLADVLNRRAGSAGGGGCTRIEQQILRGARVYVEGERAAAVQELEIRAAVHGAVCLPFQVVIAQCNLSKSGHDAGARTVDVIERVAGAAAELRDDASARNLLIAGHAVRYPEHHVREESVLR